MKVILGMVYNIDVLVKSSPSDPDSVYRPVFFDVQKQKTYNGQRLYEERDRRTEEL